MTFDLQVLLYNILWFCQYPPTKYSMCVFPLEMFRFRRDRSLPGGSEESCKTHRFSKERFENREEL